MLNDHVQILNRFHLYSNAFCLLLENKKGKEEHILSQEEHFFMYSDINLYCGMLCDVVIYTFSLEVVNWASGQNVAFVLRTLQNINGTATKNYLSLHTKKGRDASSWRSVRSLVDDCEMCELEQITRKGNKRRNWERNTYRKYRYRLSKIIIWWNCIETLSLSRSLSLCLRMIRLHCGQLNRYRRTLTINSKAINSV